GSRCRAPGYGWSSRSAYRSIQPLWPWLSVGEKLERPAHQRLRVPAAVRGERLSQRAVRLGGRVPEPLEGVQRRLGGSSRPAPTGQTRACLGKHLKLAELVGQ